MDDKLLEVVGLGGPTHEALVRLYLTSGKRIAQGAHVEVTIQKPGVSVAMAVRSLCQRLDDCILDLDSNALPVRRRAFLAGAVHCGREAVGSSGCVAQSRTDFKLIYNLYVS